MTPFKNHPQLPPRQGPARVTFVGAGPGDPSLLTLAAVAALADADAVLVDRVARQRVIDAHCTAQVEVIDAGHGEHGVPLAHATRAKLIIAAAKRHAGGHVVRLMDGDSAFFNGLAEEALACHKAGIHFEVVPGVSAVAAVPAYAGIPLTTSASTGVHVVTAGTPLDPSALHDADATYVVVGSASQVQDIFATMLDAGLDPRTPVAVTDHGTTVAQHTDVGVLAESHPASLDPDEPVMAIVGPTVALRNELSWFETKPLFGWTVLVPRTKDQAGPAIERLASHGATAAVVPTISVEPPRTPQQMDRAIKGLVTGRYEWIGFTSVNAVRAVREKFQEYGLDARAFAGLRIAAVGGVTAQALRDWGLQPDLVPSGEQSALGLLQDWPPYDELLDPIDRVFLPRADIATDTLVAGLQDIGWQVDDVTAYRTVRASPPAPEIRDAIKAGRFDAVLFTSSSTVRNLVGIAGKPHPATVVACIGPATAKTAEEYGLRVDVLAPEASVDALVDALADFGSAYGGDDSGARRKPSDRRNPARRRAR